MKALDRQARGTRAEAIARTMLIRQGMETVATNVRFRQGELDIVMRDGNTLVFVEVRYRSHNGFGGGGASVDRRKQLKIIRAAQLFLAGHSHYADWPCRFDVIEATGDPAAPDIHWIRAAFDADTR